MNINEKLSFLQELISCSNKLYLWEFSPDLELVHTNCPTDMATRDVITFLNFADSLMQYVKEGASTGWVMT